MYFAMLESHDPIVENPLAHWLCRFFCSMVLVMKRAKIRLWNTLTIELYR